MLGKGFLTVESVLAALSPGISTMNIAANYASRRILGGGDIKREAAEFLKELCRFPSSALKNSAKLSRLLDAAQAGRLTVRVENARQDTLTDTVNRMVNRIVFGLVLAALIIGSSVVISSDKGSAVSAVGVAGYVGAGIMGFRLLISIIKSNRF